MNIEQALKRLFDFQKFEKNPRLEKMIKEAGESSAELSDEDLSGINAAGEVDALQNLTDGAKSPTERDAGKNN